MQENRGPASEHEQHRLSLQQSHFPPPVTNISQSHDGDTCAARGGEFCG